METSRVMAYRNGNCTEDQGYRMIALQDLEEAHNVSIQAERKEKNDSKLPRSHGTSKADWCYSMTTGMNSFRESPKQDEWGCTG